MKDERIKSYLKDRLKKLEDLKNERKWVTSELDGEERWWTAAELGDMVCCKQTLEFIDSLQEEPVSEELEEAAWQYYDKNKPLMPPELDLHKELIDFFKAGARWKEQNDSNLSEVLNRDNLDEMAEEYSSCTYLEEVLGEGDREVLKARLKNTFKAGAKWQKKKMVSKDNSKC